MKERGRYSNAFKQEVLRLAETTDKALAELEQELGQGIHAYENTANEWFYPVPDSLHSVRMDVSDDLDVQGARNLAPFGEPFGVQASFSLPYTFTGGALPWIIPHRQSLRQRL
jgi:hypothetical protein